MAKKRSQLSIDTASPTTNAVHSGNLWPAALVLTSLLVFLASDQRFITKPSAVALAYAPTAIAAFAGSAYCWLKFKRMTQGLWLGSAASLMLFGILGVQQMVFVSFGIGQDQSNPLPWQPWSAARLVLALGLLSAYAAPPVLLPQAAKAQKSAISTIIVVSIAFCPLWTKLVPRNLYIEAMSGLSIFDTMMLIFGGLLQVVTFLRATKESQQGENFHNLLSAWLLALAWSAACRMFPYGESQIAFWVEMLVCGAASMIICTQLIWTSSGSVTTLENRIALMRASREALAAVAGFDREEASRRFLERSSDTCGFERGMLLLLTPDNNSLEVTATHPEALVLAKPGQILSLEKDRRTTFADGPTARCLAQKQTVVVSEVESDVVFVDWKVIAQEAAYQVATPLVYNDECVGALVMWYPESIWQPWRSVPAAQTATESASAAFARFLQIQRANQPAEELSNAA